MNVIKVQHPYRNGKKTKLEAPRICGAEQESDRSEHRWHGFLEALLFGLIAIVCAWPMFAAAEAVLRYL
jgi:hypothetical protein